MALHWQDQGAKRLHLVDLDGAFSGATTHREVVRSIVRSLAIPVQFGGGLRTLEQIEMLLDLGAERVILGTAAVEHPEIVERAVQYHRDRIAIGIDARKGMVRLRGWVEQTAISAVDLARKMKATGVARIIYTDVSRDGTLRGVNVEETERLARRVGIRVIASGGVAGIRDVRALWERRGAGIEGVILGRALYEKKLDLRQALQAVASYQP